MITTKQQVANTGVERTFKKSNHPNSGFVTEFPCLKRRLPRTYLASTRPFEVLLLESIRVVSLSKERPPSR